jgi:hypothetical protein
VSLEKNDPFLKEIGVYDFKSISALICDPKNEAKIAGLIKRLKL